jgi:hypothetical protein
VAIISNNVGKWIDPNFSLLEVLIANSMWRSRLKNLWRILCESFSSSKKQYQSRAGIEGTISQAVRVT